MMTSYGLPPIKLGDVKKMEIDYDDSAVPEKLLPKKKKTTTVEGKGKEKMTEPSRKVVPRALRIAPSDDDEPTVQQPPQLPPKQLQTSQLQGGRCELQLEEHHSSCINQCLLEVD